MIYFVLISLAVILAFILFRNKNVGRAEPFYFSDIDVKEAKEMISKGKFKALDVRTSLEVGQGKISGSKNINFASPTFENELALLDKNQPYIVYCRSGRRSRSACKIMAKQGFKEIYNLEGGYLAWH